jgi:group I intron endonuclease
MVINRALKKYSHSNFSLEILEYCAKSDVIVREQYYFDLLNPEYNILQVAGSSLGFKHSLETLEKLSALQTGRVLSEETRAKLSKAHKGKPLSEKALAKLIGRKQSEETKAKMRASALCRLNHNRGKSITVFDKETNETYAFDKMSELSKMFGVSLPYFSKHLGRGKNSFVYKGRYLIEKTKKD